MKKESCEYCFEKLKNCICEFYTCSECRKSIPSSLTYEYRGVYSCEECHSKSIKKRDFERQQIIEEEKHKTDRFRGLDLSDSSIGKANREILKKDIEIAKNESKKIKNYENQ